MLALKKWCLNFVMFPRLCTYFLIKNTSETQLCLFITLEEPRAWSHRNLGSYISFSTYWLCYSGQFT